MKDYPTISKETIRGISIYAFDKCDGSHIRAEWNKKQKFYKFGSRGRLLGTDQPFISEAKEIIITKYEQDLSDIFKKNNWERAIVFFEFFGVNSFAGMHVDEPHDVLMFDVNPYKKGILPPKEYINYFGHLDIASLLYHGVCDEVFEELVRSSRLEGMSLEGVVCKAKNSKNTSMPVMFKIKARAWLEKLKEFCAGDEKKFIELV